MGKLSDLIKNNRIYVILLLFILAINIFVFTDWLISDRSVKETVVSDASDVKNNMLFDEEDMKIRQQKIKGLYHEDPILYGFIGVLNLLITFLLFVGFFIDSGLLYYGIKKKRIVISKIETESPRWNIADVFRVILIFLSSGYFFVILEGFIFDSFPGMYNQNMEMLLNTALMNIVGISVVYYFVKKKYGQSLETIGVTRKNIFLNVTYAICGYIALLPILAVIMLVTYFLIKWIGYQPPVQPVVEILMEEKDAGVLWFSVVFAAVFGPVVEEIFFRGFMYKAVKKRFGIFWGILGTSVIFSVLHAHLVGIAPIIVLGVFLAYIYEKTGSLIAPITVHIIHNMGMVALTFAARSLS